MLLPHWEPGKDPHGKCSNSSGVRLLGTCLAFDAGVWRRYRLHSREDGNAVDVGLELYCGWPLEEDAVFVDGLRLEEWSPERGH